MPQELTTPPSETKQAHENQRGRDAVSLLMLGTFFNVMGGLVLVATFWTLDRPHAMVVNLVAGGLLLVIGASMTFGGLRVRRSGPTEPS